MTGVEQVAGALQTLRRVVLGLIGLMMLLAVGLIVLGVHILGRQHLADQRNRHATEVAENNRQAVCAVLNSIPPRQRNGPVRQARRLDRCDDLPVPIPHLATTPSPSSVAAPPTVVITVSQAPGRPGRSGPRPRPSRSPEPSRSPPPTPAHSPHPTPSPTPTCSLRHVLKCVPTLGAT